MLSAEDKQRIRMLLLGVVTVATVVILAIPLPLAFDADIHADDAYADNYRKAQKASTPETAIHYLQRYLHDINGTEGYSGWWYKNEDTSVREHRVIVQSIIDRCRMFENRSNTSILRSEAVEYRVAWSDVKEDMRDARFNWRRYTLVQNMPYLLNLCILNLFVVFPLTVYGWYRWKWEPNSSGYGSSDAGFKAAIAIVVGLAIGAISVGLLLVALW